MRLAELDRDWSARVSRASESEVLRILSTLISWMGSFPLLSGLVLAHDLVLRDRLGLTLGLPPAAKVVSGFLIVGAVVFVAKWAWRRARPREIAFDRGSLDRYSFPSGHAARAGVLAVLIPRPAVLAFAAAVLLARVAGRRHYLSDVLAGFAIGLVCAYVLNLVWASLAAA